MISLNNASPTTSSTICTWQTPIFCCKCTIKDVDYHVSLHLQLPFSSFGFVCEVHSLTEPIHVISMISLHNAALTTSRTICTWQTPILCDKCNIKDVDYHVSLHLQLPFSRFGFVCQVHSISEPIYVISMISLHNAALTTSSTICTWQTPILCCKCTIKDVDYHVILHLQLPFSSFGFVCQVHSLSEPIYVISMISLHDAALTTSSTICTWQTPILCDKCNIKDVDYHVSLHLQLPFSRFGFVCQVHSISEPIYVISMISLHNAALTTSSTICTWQTPILCCKCTIKDVDYHVILHLQLPFSSFGFVCQVHSLSEPIYVISMISLHNAAPTTSSTICTWQTPILCCKCNIKDVDYHVNLHFHFPFSSFGFVCQVHSLSEPIYVISMISLHNATPTTSSTICTWQTPILCYKRNIKDVDCHVSLHLQLPFSRFGFGCQVHSLSEPIYVNSMISLHNAALTTSSTICTWQTPILCCKCTIKDVDYYVSLHLQ